jgi:hypothetical protein
MPQDVTKMTKDQLEREMTFNDLRQARLTKHLIQQGRGDMTIRQLVDYGSTKAVEVVNLQARYRELRAEHETRRMRKAS